MLLQFCLASKVVVDVNRKTPTHLVRHGIWEIQSRPRVWKRLRVWERSGSDPIGAKARKGASEWRSACSCYGHGGDWLRPSGACAGPRLQAVHEA